MRRGIERRAGMCAGFYGMGGDSLAIYQDFLRGGGQAVQYHPYVLVLGHKVSL